MIYVDHFLKAYLFDDEAQAESFIRRHGLKVEDCQLFRLDVEAIHLPWPNSYRTTENKILIIISVDMYRDGGTYEIKTNKGKICVDGRLLSRTLGYLYAGYPKEDNSNIIKDYLELEKELLSLLVNCKEYEGIKKLIESKH